MDIFDCWIYIVKNMNMFEQMPFSEKYPVFRKLAEIGDLRKLSREELEFYDEDIKNMRDIYATRKFDEKRLPGGSCIPRVAFSVLYSPLASHLAKKRSLTKLPFGVLLTNCLSTKAFRAVFTLLVAGRWWVKMNC